MHGMRGKAYSKSKDMKLIIFDLDQTLVEVLKYHQKAFALMFQEVFHKPGKLSETKPEGNTIYENITTVALLHGISKKEIKKKMKQAISCLEKHFLRIFPKNATSFALPGVYPLLSNLKKYHLALVTGSPERIGKIILQNTKLINYFNLKFFATSSKTRKQLISKAIQEAKKRIKVKKKEILVVGDSIHDIDAAKSFKVLAVATGHTSMEELKKHKPAYLVKNFKDYRKVVRVIECM
ncbi:HAD family hydrolase [Candidatus Woesearchaeota archaeon]|nr:HAD family hydrolase [Candidatus Woesearchaeota archaeon]